MIHSEEVLKKKAIDFAEFKDGKLFDTGIWYHFDFANFLSLLQIPVSYDPHGTNSLLTNGMSQIFINENSEPEPTLNFDVEGVDIIANPNEKTVKQILEELADHFSDLSDTIYGDHIDDDQESLDSYRIRLSKNNFKSLKYASNKDNAYLLLKNHFLKLIS
jgi:hypothetical protein